jgi:hypothetical protein
MCALPGPTLCIGCSLAIVCLHTGPCQRESQMGADKCACDGQPKPESRQDPKPAEEKLKADLPVEWEVRRRKIVL